MRRAVFAIVTSAVLTLAGLVLVPTLRATALGETSVTLGCDDGTSLTLLVDAETLTGLTEAVSAMAQYPAGLSCTLVQNLINAPFGNIALAAGPKSFVVAGGRWQVECAFILGQDQESFVGSGYKSARLIVDGPALRSQIDPGETCAEPCIWINIAVNAHTTGDGTVKGTLNQTIPEHQFCPTPAGPLQMGPSHFTSKTVCYVVDGDFAFVNSQVTRISGLPFPRGLGFFGIGEGEVVQFGFHDGGNPPQPVDRLNGPPLSPTIIPEPAPECLGPAPVRFMSNGNISVHP